LVTLEFSFAYIVYITPHFLTLRPHLHILALENNEERLRVRVCVRFVRVERIVIEFLGIFNSSKCVKHETLSK
jgi:hypothetical protein